MDHALSRHYDRLFHVEQRGCCVTESAGVEVTMFVPQNTYVVNCRRDGAWWQVEVPGVTSAVTVTGLADADQAARRLIEAGTAIRPQQIELTLRFDVSAHTQGLIDAALAARRNADRMSPQAVSRRRMLARRLTADGFTAADVAFLLGVSLVRVQQLIGAATGPRPRAGSSRRSRPRPAPHVRRGHDTGRARPHSSYKHEALFYRGNDGFLAQTVPFVREGLRLNQPVMVAVIQPRLELLRDALGADADAVRFVDMGQLGANPAQIIPCWRRFVDEHAELNSPMRGIGEPIWAGRRPEELRECQLHEALLNLAVGPDTPMWLSCPYDLDALSDDVVAEAQRSHPAVVDGAGYRGSTTYGGLHHVDEIFRSELPPPAGSAAQMVIRPGTLGQIGGFVSARAQESGLDAERIDAVVTAIDALAASSVLNGDGRGLLSIWRDERALVCEVADRGRFDDPLIGRIEPGDDDAAARAVWLANQLCDLTQSRSTPKGAVVRLLTWL